MHEDRFGLETALVHQLFEAQVLQSPDTVAVEFEDRQLTYQVLNSRANQLARHLQDLGIEPDRLVGICMERSLEMIVALLGVLKAGAAYVPLDPSYPNDRLAWMAQDAQISILLTQSHLATHLPPQRIHLLCLDTDWSTVAGYSALNLDCEASVDHLAYVIYTSGSTGKPKGVAMPHRPLVNLITWQLTHSTVATGKTLQFSPISFDVSFQEIFSTFAAGGTLVLVSDVLRRDSLKLLRLLDQAAIERLFLPFIALQYLSEAAVKAGIAPAHLREVITAGEQLRITSAIAHWFTQLDNCTLHNHYGPSETHVVTAFTLTGSPQAWALLPPIGKAIARTQIYLLNEQLQPVSIGESGEIYIGGVSLARGYLNRPDLTEARFIPNPFAAQAGERLYKTGDLARALPDGMIEYLGRADQQVKIRGYRIEPGEIESILENHPAVRESVVVAREDVPGDKRLVAYAVLNPSGVDHNSPTPDELRQFLKVQLPEYMVPSAVVLLDKFPLLPSGKIGRRSLPAPDRNLRSEPLTAPESQTEIMLAAIWADVLGLEQVGIDHSFLELGGHSLLAAQIVYRIRDAFQVELPFSSLFETPTIGELASTLEQAQRNGGSTQRLPIQPAPRDRHLPLSLMQEPLWFLAQLVPNHPFYNVPEVFHLHGSVNAGALERSFQEAIQRHEALRTTFASVDGKPVQVIHSSPDFKLPLVDLTLPSQPITPHLREALRSGKVAQPGFCSLGDQGNGQNSDANEHPLTEQEIQAWEFILKEARLPFDLSQDLLLRATLFKLGKTEYILFVNLHHIVCDDWSIEVLLQELMALYSAFTSDQASPLPELTIQSADFAVWHRQWLQCHGRQKREKQLAYWKQQLGGGLPVLQLPTDYPRPSFLTYQGARHFLTLSHPLTQALKDLSQREEVTLFMTLLAAFQALLSHYTGEKDIPVGSLFANRYHPEINQVIGFFVNPVVLRTDLSGSPTFQELLGRVKQVALEAFANQDLPFDEVVQAVQPERELNQNPLFQVLFNLQTTSTPVRELADVRLTRLQLDNGTAKFDLFLELTETPDGMTGYFEYSTDLFAAATIARMADHFQTLLESMVENPSQILSDGMIELMGRIDRPVKICSSRVKSGEIDLQALPAPNRNSPAMRASFMAPRTPIEGTLAAIWAQILGLDGVGIQDNFFELGGHSLLAARLLAQIETTFQVKLSLAHIFMAPTIERLAQIVGELQRGSAAIDPTPHSLNLWSEAVLDPAIDPQFQSSSVHSLHAPANVLLTGATGFLGAFLLHELLEQTQATVYCLVRGGNVNEAQQRLQRSLSAYSLWQPEQCSRIIPVVGDLSLPLLGLSSEQFSVLANTIDIIYHNGGVVNFVYPYSMLKAANVLGTQEVLRLAGQSKIKPVHFISTVGVFSPLAYADGQILGGQDLPDRPEGLYGYTQSKWVAEKLMAIAQVRGIPTTVHRPAWIEGHSQTGVCNQSDFLRSLIKGCIQLEVAPDWNMPIDVVPVDFISRAIVHLSQQSTSLGKAYNFSNPHTISWHQLVDWMRGFGYPVQQIPYPQWIAEVRRRVQQSPENALYPFLAFLTEPVPESQRSVPEIYFRTKSIRFDCQTLMDDLATMTSVYPSIDDQLLTTYFSYFVRTGFLEAPMTVL